MSSRFAFGRGPGAFRAGGDIVTAKSDSALIEFMKELRGIRGARPITDDEMQAAKNALIQSLPAEFRVGRRSERRDQRRSTRRICRRTTTRSSCTR